VRGTKSVGDLRRDSGAGAKKEPPASVVMPEGWRRFRLWIIAGALAICAAAGAVFYNLNRGAAPKQPPKASLQAGQTRQNSVDGLTYVWIPPGRFEMGCSMDAAGKYDAECYDDEKPSHPENIPAGFWMGQTEVTVGAYQKWPEAKNHALPTSDSLGRKLNTAAGDPNLPAVFVTWQEAQDYCKWAGGLRLPTEKEWEYAARAGSTDPRYGNLDSVAWYAVNSGSTKINSTQWWNENSATYADRLFKNGNGPHPVQQKQKNAWNLHDTLGNVWEWVEDWYGAYPGGTIPNGEGGQKYRVLRGGSWDRLPRYVRVSVRNRYDPGAPRQPYGGFRCAGELR
jgi:formylglycine-generating enzyme required for sulfatase activity